MSLKFDEFIIAQKRKF